MLLSGLGALSLAALLVAWSVYERGSRPEPSLPAAAFDLPRLSGAGEAAIAAAPPAAAAPEAPAPFSSLMAPIPLENMSGASPRTARAGPGKVPVVTAKAVRWVRTHKLFTSFLKTPARYLTQRSGRLSSPRALRAFLNDSKQVNAYLDAPLVRVALNSPVVSRALMSDPDVLRAFFGSPAMQDKDAVKALLQSALLRKVLDCPGPQGALEDGKTLPAALTDPAMLAWMRENPDALKGLREALPELAAALPPAPRRRR